jgi:hypothetical protein
MHILEMESSIDGMVNYSQVINLANEMQKIVYKDKHRIKKSNYSKKNKSRESLNNQHNFKQHDLDMPHHTECPV